ncbi:MAG: GIY-YIG nuclease family protein [Paeniclostridium sordellii]|nr:GIY-YIG nuclease family protein [Paeniclostridium sordellii]
MGQIYKIKNLINGKVYIGQTYKTFEDRYGINGIKSVLSVSKNEHLKSSIRKYGTDSWEISILEETNSREELDIFEEYYILEYNSIDNRYGYNKKKGGGNHEFSEDTKEKMRQINIEMRGKKVICINNLKIYDSVSTAARELGNANPDNIRNCCKGRSATAYGLYWEYYDENKQYIKNNNRFKPSFERPVVRINDKKIYETVKSAADDIGVTPGALVMAIKEKSTVLNKYQYSYYNTDIPLEALKLFKVKNLKMVRSKTTGKIFDSVKECADALDVKACTITSIIKNYRNVDSPKCKGNELEYIEIYDLPKEVVNVSTGRIYRSISEASQQTKKSKEDIYDCIIGVRLDLDDEHWDYYNNGDSYWLKESSRYYYRYRPVININTNEIFMGIKYAVNEYELNYKEIQGVCTGENYLAGGFQWSYWSPGGKYRLKDIRSATTRIICYTTGEIFKTLTEASKKYNVVRGNITMVCQGKDRGSVRNYAGVHPETGEPLYWGYLDKPKKQETHKAVKCIETNMIYRSLSHAQEETGIQKGNIRHVCNGTRKKAGGYTWEYIDNHLVEYDIKEIRKNPNEKHILCLNDGKVHKNISAAAEYYGIKSTSNLSVYLSGKNNNRHVKGYKFIYYNKEFNFVLTPKVK